MRRIPENSPKGLFFTNIRKYRERDAIACLHANGSPSGLPFFY